MREQQRHVRVSRRKAIHRPVLNVEFLDADVVQQPDHLVRRAGWPTRVAILGLVVAASAAWVVTRGSEVRPSAGAPPAAAHAATARPTTTPDLSYVLAAAVPTPVARTMSQVLPGISIRPATAGARWVDARYKHLGITVDIAPGRPPSGPTVQTVTSGASDVHVIHNRRPGARRTVTITVVAPQHVHLPTARLQRMADALGRLPAW
jgi:hypothetical protein